MKIAQFCVDFGAQTMVQQNSLGLNLKSGVLLIRRHKISDEENDFFLGRPNSAPSSTVCEHLRWSEGEEKLLRGQQKTR